MNKTLKRLKYAWEIIIGKKDEIIIITEGGFRQLTRSILEDEKKLIQKYGERIYNIVEMAIPNDKIAIMKKGVDDVFKVMVESINLHVIHELEKLNTKTNGSIKDVSGRTGESGSSKTTI